MRRLNVLIWHVHGAYLYYLTQAPHEFYLPSKPDRRPPYTGRWGHIPWGANVHDVPVERLRELRLDCAIYQSSEQLGPEAERWLSEEQRRLPRIYLEHDPPLDHPTEKLHPAGADPGTLLVHVTHFNALMWDSGRARTRVIEHGVLLPEGARYRGDIERGIVVINNIASRGRRTGPDIYGRCRERVPLDLVGMGTDGIPGGLGEVLHRDLPAFEARYRFFFNPVRYTSLNLAVCEAMMLGMPVVGLATTEMATAVPNGVAGFVDTSVEGLIPRMRELLDDPALARSLGEAARRRARERFGIRRFVRDWDAALREVAGG